MKRRLIAALAAVLLAVVGGTMLLVYVSNADRRAMADLEPSTVLVVTQAVAEGADAMQIAKSVTARELPGVAVAPDAVSSLRDLEGLTTTTALQPGEQLLRSRLIDPAVLAAAEGVVIPPDLLRLSLKLEPQRMVGGAVEVGDTVAVFLSTEDKDVTRTQLSLRKVLVAAVDRGPAAVEGSNQAQTPSETLTVTLAAKALDIEKIVFAAEHGTVWLAADPAKAPQASTPVLTKENLYK